MKIRCLLLVVMLFMVNVSPFAMEMMTKRQIYLNAITHLELRSVPVSPKVFLEGASLSIELPSVAASVTVIVKNVETGEVVYKSTDTGVDALVIDLSVEDAGKYKLEVQLPTSTFGGEFSLLEY